MSLYTRLRAYLDAAPWWRYYFAHALIALAMQGACMLALCWSLGIVLASAIGAWTGFIFYLSRKICEYTYDIDPANRWDWPGLLWPTGAVLILHAGIIFLKG